MKVLVFYTVTLSMLFGALTVLFSALGVGTGEPPTPPAPLITPTLNTTATALYEDDPEPDIKYGHLLEKRMYQVEFPVDLFTQRGENATTSVQLPAKGVFLVERRIDAVDTLWYRVRVNDGERDYRLFLRALDLNWQTVKRFRTRRPTRAQLYQEKMEEKLARDPGALVKENFGQPPSERDLAIIAERERLQQEAEMQTMQAKLNTGLQTYNSKGILSSALLAGIVTFAMAAMLGAIAWLRFTKRWTSGSEIEALWGDEGEDYLPEEDLYEQQSLPNSHNDDPYA